MKKPILSVIDENGNVIPIRAIQGQPGITPHIGENENWYIGDKDTGVKAKGQQGPEGKSGVYVGSDTPPAGMRVWINPNGKPTKIPKVDGTLTQPGYAADAKAVGEKINQLSGGIADLGNDVSQMAANQIPEAYVKAAVDEYVAENSGGFAPSEYVDKVIGDIAETTQVSTLIKKKESGTEILPDQCTTGTGYLRGMSLSRPGDLQSSSNSRWFSFHAEEDMDIYIPLKTSIGTIRNICVFDNSEYGTENRVTPVYQSNDDTYPLPGAENPLHVSAGQYITCSYYNTLVTLSNFEFEVYSITPGDYAIKSTAPLTEKMAEEVDEKIHSRTNDIMQDGYFLLDTSKFARGGWNGYDQADSRSFRVRYTESLKFDHDIYVLSEDGFVFYGYFESGSFGGGSTAIKKIPASTKFEIYVRRITEDTSETADVATFATKIKFSTALAPIELYYPTFTDVSMFERIGVGGDSYASSGGVISGKRNLSWGKNLERQAGVSVDIYARSGESLVQWVTDNTNGLPALLAGTECGLYLFQHGINGTGGAMTLEELGTPADMSADPHPQTFYGQYVEAIEQIHDTFPTARIILLSIAGTAYGLSQTTYAPVNQAIQDIAEYCGDMWIDITKDDFIRSTAYSENMLSNHPTSMVNAGIAMAYRRLIARCILDNPEYFRRYGSDNDDGGHPST